MRLIDADVMHREIDKYDPEGRMSLKNIKRYIDAQPTAYDTDKVIEQFKECSFRDPYGYGDDLIDIGYAIEIVKDGCEPRKNLQELIGKSEWIPVSESADCTHKECEHYGNILYTRHEVACIIADLLCNTCACDYSGNDEWLPQYCDFADKVCPNTVGVACWEQYLAHIDKKAGVK